MVNSYYTLRALAREWHADLEGTTVRDVYSQTKNELTVALSGAEQDWMVRGSVQRPFLYLFRRPGYHKARRNVATLFEGAIGQSVAGVSIADRDRLVSIELGGGGRILWQLFGARANAFHVAPDGTVVAAFQRHDELTGTAAPEPYAAPMPDTFEAFENRWKPNRNKTRQAVQSAVSLFGGDLARETLHRAGVTTNAPADCTAAERRALFEASMALREALQDPAPLLYGAGQFPDAFSLIPLRHREDEPAERFDTVDAAVADFVRRTLAEQHFHRLYDPLEEALESAAEHERRSAERMVEELQSESRAGRYERWGHLLMAQQDQVPDGAEEVELPDLFEDGAPVTIPVDPAKSPVENAEHYYDRARSTRRSREEAEGRLDDTIERAERAEALLQALREIDTLDGIKAFRDEREAELLPFVERDDADVDDFPFRRFDLGEGFEVWVGKNARQNHDLTFHASQPYDLWLHARGVPGAHTVLHRPNRDAEPGKRRRYVAAAIAAHYSKSKGSDVAPVMITERKYVTSPTGADPGVVRVDREDVLMVEPGLPE
ncbi:putative ribosome quality control (RQC) complex YloA/Tae2 family protein [Salinibacter ruber]|uniref:Rqc2 family fibronectin-binding protein n=1 Tax=Salinibacter ruber TaxID=146919 RepID=UPI0021671C0B|nr:putative ribosome quality control (RQC) complex YloA/Tae2 family protein [Salinibacter ruber]MCS4138125.1 putative ribosome quality control (RQC) complex YloA/Tae2 family protein [Salinibacter ruber]MCS4196714.1 putative ribosome quality control (RQC) complex YloA/Tae2 family protein [Salinibacter ruber]